ncbi:MAG: efflux RND transporter periplasmic adaptor subunit [Parvibaculum sp.]
MKRVTATLLLAGLLACPKDDHRHPEDEEHARHDDNDEAALHDEGRDGIVELTLEVSERIRIPTAAAQLRAVGHVLSTTGRVDFNQDHYAHVAPRVPGRVHRVDVSLGASVKRGQTLAVIDSLELGRTKSVLLRARSQLELAEKTLARERELAADRITSQQSLLESKAAVQAARAEYQAARQSLKLLGLTDAQLARVDYGDPAAAHFPIRSPIAGTVVEKHVNLGEVVAPDDNLYSITDLSRVWIWIDVYERDLRRVHLDDHVVVTVAAYPDRTFEGAVAYIRSQIDPATRTAQARIDVPNGDGALRPGMFAKISVADTHPIDGELKVESVVVPASAVQRDGDESIVFVSLGERRYERREVALGRRTETHIEILAGLDAGETVVTGGTFFLKSEAAKSAMGGGHSH